MKIQIRNEEIKNCYRVTLLFLVEMGSSFELRYTREEIFTMIKEHLQADLDGQLSILEKSISKTKNIDFQIPPEEIKNLKLLLSKFKSRWRDSGRKSEYN